MVSGEAEGDTRTGFVFGCVFKVLSGARRFANNNGRHAADGTWLMERLRTFDSNVRLKRTPATATERRDSRRNRAVGHTHPHLSSTTSKI